MYALNHIALFVPDLRATEVFYQQVFDMEVLFREASMDDGDYTLPAGTGWEEANQAGIEISVVFLGRGGFVQPIFAGDPQPGTVLEIGITASQEEIDAVRNRLPDDGALLPHPHGDCSFADPFGFTWHLYPPSETLLSNGELSGAWLDL